MQWSVPCWMKQGQWFTLNICFLVVWHCDSAVTIEYMCLSAPCHSSKVLTVSNHSLTHHHLMSLPVFLVPWALDSLIFKYQFIPIFCLSYEAFVVSAVLFQITISAWPCLLHLFCFQSGWFLTPLLKERGSYCPKKLYIKMNCTNDIKEPKRVLVSIITDTITANPLSAVVKTCSNM